MSKSVSCHSRQSDKCVENSGWLLEYRTKDSYLWKQRGIYYDKKEFVKMTCDLLNSLSSSYKLLRLQGCIGDSPYFRDLTRYEQESLELSIDTMLELTNWTCCEYVLISSVQKYICKRGNLYEKDTSIEASCSIPVLKLTKLPVQPS